MEDNRKNNGKGQKHTRNEWGQFTEGNPGRPKGVKNKQKIAMFTQKQQAILMRVFDNQMQYLEPALERMTDKERFDTIAKFYKYMMPIRSSVEVDAFVEGDINIIVKHKKPEAEEPNED